jgi:acyl carrier protein
MDAGEILDLMNLVVTKRGVAAIADTALSTRDAKFRSLDFSEVALRIEDKIGRELSFDAAQMRRIVTVKDVIDFFQEASRAA